MVEGLDLNKVKITQKLMREIEKYEKFANGVIGEQAPKMKLQQINLKTYAKYVLMDGTREEKRELLECLNNKIYLKDREVYLAN